MHFYEISIYLIWFSFINKKNGNIVIIYVQLVLLLPVGVVVEPRTLKVHHILLESNEKALDVLNMTKVGTESFASLARRHSR